MYSSSSQYLKWAKDWHCEIHIPFRNLPFRGGKKERRKDTEDNNSSKIHGKKQDEKLQEKERNRYDLFPFVSCNGFGCLATAAAIAGAATIIYYSLF